MADYISREAAVTIADYAADEHPYDKNPKQPETYSEYNQGWNDACDYIRDRLEREKPADVEPVRHGNWNIRLADELTLCLECSICGRRVDNIDLHYLLEAGEYGEACQRYPYCHCGAKMIRATMEGEKCNDN